MVFNTEVFAVFFAVVIAAYFALQFARFRGAFVLQNAMLVIASYVFYGWWDYRFTSLLLFSTVLDYLIGRGIEAARERGTGRARLLLIVSCVCNLGLLGVFKYFDFFVLSAADALESVGLSANLPLLKVVLPVGISFYTFQTMSYTIDVYRGKQAACRDPLAFALYVSFFPQLVAGPIERSTHLLPQVQNPRRVTLHDLRHGSALMVMGFFKKMFIADSAAVHVDAIFGSPESHDSVTLMLGVYLFAVQIYGDFAGYTDIARGTARVLGFDICLNFRQPYLSASITEFWRRWHISLSAWLRDYLYIPLGGNRKGPVKTYRNLMIVMLLGGLWHGAAWTFVLWGALHGLFLALERLFWGNSASRYADEKPRGAGWLPWFLRVALTFHLVCFCWIFFRAEGIENAFDMIGGLLSGSEGDGPTRGLLIEAAVLFGAVFLVDVLCWRGDRESPVSARWPAALRGVAYAVMILLASFVGPSDSSAFIYFQF